MSEELDMTFGDWLNETLDLQRSAFDTNPPELEGIARADYVRWNVLAAVDELTEFLNEVQWKPWAKAQGAVFDRGAAVGEIVDVMHFIANLLCTLGVTGEELTNAYLEKMGVNKQRQEDGYEHRKAVTTNDS